ncbi:MAG: hypothetical protein ACK4ND_18070 [Cytophagaceae bacterium]
MPDKKENIEEKIKKLNDENSSDERLNHQLTDGMNKKDHLQHIDNSDRYNTRDEEIKHRYEK